MLPALGSTVLAASMVLAVVPQIKAGTAAGVSAGTQAIEKAYTGRDAPRDSVVRESLERTRETADQAREIAGLE